MSPWEDRLPTLSRAAPSITHAASSLPFSETACSVIPWAPILVFHKGALRPKKGTIMRMPAFPRLPLMVKLLIGLLLATHLGQAQDKSLTADHVREIQGKFKNEREAAIKGKVAEKFAPEALERADQLAKKGVAALSAGRL